MPADQAGLLIVRAWIEAASSAPLRAQLRQTTDVSMGRLDGETVTDEDALVALVRAWLADFLLEAGPADGEPPR